MDNLKWTGEYPHRRTKEQQAVCDKLIEEYMAINNCVYDTVGDIIEPTVQPKPFDKHQLSSIERLALDFEGRF